MAWLSGWSYRKEISITGQSGAGTNYQVLLDIGDSAGGDFHLEGNCTNFPEDIEVTDNDGTTLLKFWIPDKTADPLEMWVKVADDLGTNQTIYVYYGKSGATTNSNIGDTFVFGDDFPGSSLDGAKWDTNTGSPSVSSGQLSMPATSEIKTDSSFSDPIILEMSVNLNTSNYARMGFSVGTSNNWNTNALFIQPHTSTKFYPTTYKSSTYEQTDTDVFTTANHKITIIWNTDEGIFKDDGVTFETFTTYVPIVDLPIKLRADTGTTTWEYIMARKYAATEPAFSSAGSEETPPTGVSPTAVFYGPLVGPLGGPI